MEKNQTRMKKKKKKKKKKKEQNFVGAKTKIISSAKETDNTRFTLRTDCLLMITE